MKMRRLLACIMALLLSASLPVSTLADTYDLANGSVSVNASGSGQTVTQENNPDRQDYPDSNPEISSSTATSNTVTITAEENATANVTLSGVNIDTTTSTSDTAETKAAITVAGAGNVVIELDGDNTVQSGEGHAGVEKDNSGSLTITDQNGEAGSLTATGGAGSAGIGGGLVLVGNGSNIAISGGTVEATGGAGGAGIGGGAGSGGREITISGGSIKATGGDALNKGSGDKIEKGEGGGAGIGGGVGGDGSDIHISGGTVAANGGENAAGIGGGAGGDGSDIHISGGTVVANGGENAAEIGGGAGGNSSNITISGGSVNAEGGESGSGSSGDSNGQSSGNYTPDANDGDADETDDGYSAFFTGKTLYNWPKKDLSELKLTDSKGQKLTGTFRVENDELRIIIDAAKATLTGDRTDIQSLKDQGAKKTVLETERLSVSVSNDLLLEITNEDESFQLHTESTGFRLTTTDQNHQKKFEMKLTTDGTQAEQQETQKDTDGPNTDVSKPPKRLTVNIGFSEPPNNDLQKSVLRVMAEMRKATLTSDVDSIQTLIDRGIAQTVLSTSGVTSSIDHKRLVEAAEFRDSWKLTHNGNNAIFVPEIPSYTFVITTKD